MRRFSQWDAWDFLDEYPALLYSGFDEFGYIYYPDDFQTPASRLIQSNARFIFICMVPINMVPTSVSKSIQGAAVVRNAGFFEWARLGKKLGC